MACGAVPTATVKNPTRRTDATNYRLHGELCLVAGTRTAGSRAALGLVERQHAFAVRNRKDGLVLLRVCDPDRPDLPTPARARAQAERGGRICVDLKGTPYTNALYGMTDSSSFRERCS